MIPPGQDVVGKRSRRGRVLAWVALVLMILVTLAPLFSMVKTALTHPDELYAHATELLPTVPTSLNFRRVFGGAASEESQTLGGAGADVDFARAFLNSLEFTAIVVVLQTMTSAMAAYAFARLKFPGKQVLFALFIGSMMLPSVVLFIPNFILIKELGWLNSIAGMVAPFALMSGSAIFFLRQFFLSLPRDLEEAAIIDGASHFLIFWRIILPLSATPLATIAMLTGIACWNEFFWPFIVAPGEEFQVLPTALQSFKAQTPQGQVDWTGLMAAACITALPSVVLLVAFGRRVVESVQFSGGK
jgi:multiple sugar transport system permease protein